MFNIHEKTNEIKEIIQELYFKDIENNKVDIVTRKLAENFITDFNFFLNLLDRTKFETDYDMLYDCIWDAVNKSSFFVPKFIHQNHRSHVIGEVSIKIAEKILGDCENKWLRCSTFMERLHTE